MTSQRRVTFADIRDGDLLVDERHGARWLVSAVTTLDEGLAVAYTIAGAEKSNDGKVFNLTAPVVKPVTVEREWEPAADALKARIDAMDARRVPLAREVKDRSVPRDPHDVGPAHFDVEAASQGRPAWSHPHAVKAAADALGAEAVAEFSPGEQAAADNADTVPPSVPAFADLDDLQMRTHTYLLHPHMEDEHGIWTRDITSRAELARLHDQAHRDQAAGRLQSKYRPHRHEEPK